MSAESWSASSKVLSSDNPKDSDEYCNVKEAIRYEQDISKYTYDEKDIILYALGVGAGQQDPTDPDELQYIYENDANFTVLPSFGVIPPFYSISQVVSVPGLVFNPMKLLHGEAYVEIHKPLTTTGSLRNHSRILDIYDKKKAACVLLEVRSYNENDELVLYNRCVYTKNDNKYTYIIQYIFFIGQHYLFEVQVVLEVKLDPNQIPNQLSRYKDIQFPKTLNQCFKQNFLLQLIKYVFNIQLNIIYIIIYIKIYIYICIQAILYRQSGDMNPQHIDPSMAAIGGFNKPILHGLCTFGIAVRILVKLLCNNDPSIVTCINVRFAKAVYPGQTLIIQAWRYDNNPAIYIYRVLCKETNEVVLSNGYIRQKDKIDNKSDTVPESTTDIVDILPVRQPSPDSAAKL